MQRVGVIGLGKMGLPIARNLLEHGFAVVGYRRSGSAELAEAGGTVAASAAEVAEQANVLLSIVPDTAAVADAEAPDGADLIERLSSIGQPKVTATTVLPFAAGVQKLIDVEFEDGHRYYTKEAHVADLASEAIDKLVEFWSDMPMEGEVEIIGLGGAIGDVPEDATAFSNRGYLLWLNFAMRWDDPACDASYMDRTRAIVRDLAPWVGTGIYLNMLNFDEMDRVVEALGGPEKYARLGRVKAQYDPGNLFRANYNIVPQPAP